MEREFEFNSDEENEKLYDEELGKMPFRLWAKNIKIHGKEYEKKERALCLGCGGCAFENRPLACMRVNCVKDVPGIYVRKESA